MVNFLFMSLTSWFQIPFQKTYCVLTIILQLCVCPPVFKSFYLTYQSETLGDCWNPIHYSENRIYFTISWSFCMRTTPNKGIFVLDLNSSQIPWQKYKTLKSVPHQNICSSRCKEPVKGRFFHDFPTAAATFRRTLWKSLTHSHETVGDGNIILYLLLLPR